MMNAWSYKIINSIFIHKSLKRGEGYRLKREREKIRYVHMCNRKNKDLKGKRNE